jgi:lactate dehydrogenase-like 2-hydroxyacid dehydrogenase
MSRRRLVLLTHTLPQWIGPDIEQAFELRHIDDADSATRTEARVLITPGPARVDAVLLEQLPALQYIAAVGSGIEGIDLSYVDRRGIVVSNSAAATAEDVADHALALSLTLYARILPFDESVRSGRWPEKTLRRSLSELQAGIVGFGAIGSAIARRLEPLVAKIRWTGPRFKQTPFDFVPELHALAHQSDILLVAARADESNTAMIGPSVIQALGSRGFIVNVSRGSIIAEDALIAALKDGTVGGAALDVFSTEPTLSERWRDVPNTVLTPHVGGYASGVQRGIRQLLASNLHAFFAGETPQGVIGGAK